MNSCAFADGYSEAEFLILQEIGLALDFLLPEGFPDTPTVARRVASQMKRPCNIAHWQWILAELKEAIADTQNQGRAEAWLRLAVVADRLSEPQNFGALCEAVETYTCRATSVGQLTARAPPTTSWEFWPPGIPLQLLGQCLPLEGR